MTIAGEILNQLGGNRFIAMTGAKCYTDGDRKQTLVVKFPGSRKANLMRITLNSMDTYDIKIFKFTKMQPQLVKEVNGAYSDMLVPIFESTTGLRASL